MSDSQNSEVQEDQVEEVKKEPVAEVKAPEIVQDDLPASTIRGLVAHLHTILEEAQGVVDSYRKRSNDIDLREINVFGRELSVGQREKVLVDRESACKDVEDLKKLRKDANALMDAANLRVHAAVEAETDLKQSTASQMSLLQEERLQTQREANNVLNQKKVIEKEVAARVQAILANMGINTNAAIADLEK